MALFGWFSFIGRGKAKKRKTERLSEKGFVPSGDAASARPKVILAELTGDKGNTVGNRIAELLTGMSGVEVFHRKEKLALPDGIADPVERLILAADEGRAWLKEEGANLLVWGELEPERRQVTIRCLPAPSTDSQQAEIVGMGNSLELPMGFNGVLDPLIPALAITTFGPAFRGMRGPLGQTLAGYLERTQALTETLPEGLNNVQAASALTALGNAFAAYAMLGGGGGQLQNAVKAYRAAEVQVPKESYPLIWARIENHMAAVLQAQAVKKKDPKPLRSAALIYSTVASTLDRTKHANDWGLAQIQLGKALYILAGLEGKPEYLKRAAAAYEEALKVYDKTSAPSRWAEVTNQYGVVLLALGEEMGADATLEQAVDRFRDAMKLRHRDRAPLLWAQTANNLGAACFALAKRNSQAALLREASNCFEGATEIYRQQGVPKQAAVIEKNLQRVQRLLMTRGG